MDTHGKHRIIGLVVCIVAVLLAGAFAVWNLSKDGEDDPYPPMQVETDRDGANYCANLNTEEVARDQVVITIKNCGDAAFKIKHGPTKTKVTKGKEYKTVLPPSVDEFHAVIISTKGEFLGEFRF